MLYLSQFVFQSILFSKKKERAGDSWHRLVPSGEEKLLSSRGRCSPPTSPARPPHPQTGCRQPWPAGRELGWVDRFHQLREGKKPGLQVPLMNAQPSLPVPRPAPQPMPFGGPGAPGRTERGTASKAVAWDEAAPSYRALPTQLSIRGFSSKGCPQNPRPGMFSLQMYFHNKEADFESLLLKSKQNTKALQTSLEREGLPAPAVLPR